MNEQIFWQIIDQAKRESKNDQSKTIQILEEKLCGLSTEEIIRFDSILHEMFRIAFRSTIWAAAFIINAGCSEEEFDSFIQWLILQGQAMFNEVIKNPDVLSDLEINDVAGCEDLFFVPPKAYEVVSNEEDFEMIRDDYQPHLMIGDPKVWRDQKGEANEEKLRDMLPRLYRKYYL